VKQTKTTLFFGVLLAIIAIVWVTLEIERISSKKEPDMIENTTVVPATKNFSTSIISILNSAHSYLN
jgi:hypothetical protein